MERSTLPPLPRTVILDYYDSCQYTLTELPKGERLTTQTPITS